MDLTESIRAKIDEIRSKKTTRHTTHVGSVEQDIASLTATSSRLYLELEDALDNFETDVAKEPVKQISDASPTKSLAKQLLAAPLVSTQAWDARELCSASKTHSDLDEEEDQTDTKLPDASGFQQERIDAAVDGESNLVLVTGPFPDQELVVRSASRVENLRCQAAEVIDTLQERRNHLQECRNRFAANLARLEKLEDNLCTISGEWETEERDRLTTEVYSTQKRKAAESLEQKERKRVLIRACEVGALVAVGAVAHALVG